MHTLAWLPLVIVGLIAIGAGLLWLTSSEPWLIDRGPNERLLQMPFQTLAEQAPTVFDYLRLLYRFFGLWILGLGLLVMSYAATAYRRSENATASTLFLGVLGSILIVQTAFIVSWIPDSPFFWVNLIALLLWVISLTAYFLARSANASTSEQGQT